MQAAQLLQPRCVLLRNSLSPQEQRRLFDFIRERDATNWDALPGCMNPTPKTLELLVDGAGTHEGGEEATARTITIIVDRTSGNRGDDVDAKQDIVVELVKKAAQAAAAASIGLPSAPIESITLAGIRYMIPGSSTTIGHNLPPHVDHCNDGSWVVLFSLGCMAHFFVQSNTSPRQTFFMYSGDVLVFDPSSEAGVLHGVSNITQDYDKGTGRDTKGWGWSDSRFGVQCRIKFGCG